MLRGAHLFVRGPDALVGLTLELLLVVDVHWIPFSLKSAGISTRTHLRNVEARLEVAVIHHRIAVRPHLMDHLPCRSRPSHQQGRLSSGICEVDGTDTSAGYEYQIDESEPDGAPDRNRSELRGYGPATCGCMCEPDTDRGDS